MSIIRLNNLLTRALTGALFVSIIIFSIFLSPMLFSLLFFVVTVFTLREFFLLLRNAKTAQVQIIPGIIAGSLIYLSISAVALDILNPGFLFLNLIILPFIFIYELYQRTATPIVNVSLTILGILYISLPFAILNLFFNPDLIQGAYHPGVVLGFFVILWAYDSFAYLSGILLGRHRLFERISPKKSWEGAIGGFIFGLLAAWVLSMYYQEYNLIEWLSISGIIMFFGTFGDLSESMLKRSLDIKDSGNFLPGHGGLLDRFDAALLAAPAVYVYMNLIH